MELRILPVYHFLSHQDITCLPSSIRDSQDPAASGLQGLWAPKTSLWLGISRELHDSHCGLQGVLSLAAFLALLRARGSNETFASG